MEAVTGFLAAVGDRPLSQVVLMTTRDAPRDVMEAAWQEAIAGTVAEKALVVWEEGSDVLKCFDCGMEYDGVRLDPCPRCGGDGQVVREMPEFEVAGWTFAEETG